MGIGKLLASDGTSIQFFFCSVIRVVGILSYTACACCLFSALTGLVSGVNDACWTTCLVCVEERKEDLVGEPTGHDQVSGPRESFLAGFCAVVISFFY